MSDITANLFQFSKRTNAININPDEITDFNSKLILLSEQYGSDFANFKDLFTFLIDFATSETDFTETQTGIELKEGEVIVTQKYLDDCQTEITDKNSQISSLTEQVKKFQEEEDTRFGESVRASEAMENVLLVPVTPDQKELLIGIAQNRLDKGYETDVPGEPDSADSIIRKIAFRESYLYNEYKRFYTGL